MLNRFKHSVLGKSAVGEYSKRDEVYDASRNGVFGSKNVGTSNHNPGEITGTPKAQGFLGNVDQSRVSRS